MKITFTTHATDIWYNKMLTGWLATIIGAAPDIDDPAQPADDFQIEVYPIDLTDPANVYIQYTDRKYEIGLMSVDANTSMSYSELHWLEEHDGDIWEYSSEAGPVPISKYNPETGRFEWHEGSGPAPLFDPYADR